MADTNNPGADEVPEELRDMIEGIVRSRIDDDAQTSEGGDTEEQVGAYRLSGLLGESQACSIYRAELHRPTRVEVVAIRLIKADLNADEIVARFEAERQALALMSPPTVAKVLDAGVTKQGAPYFAMEFIPGVAITSHCDQYSLDTRERLELFVEVCAGVQHAHQHALIHHDLNPRNVLVAVEDSEPVPKIIDFGVARALNQRLTDLAKSRGRSAYMGSEQGAGAADIDTRTDIFSLGVLLHELVAGTPPLQSAMLRKSTFGETEIPEEVRGIIAKATAKEHTERYESASEFAAGVRRYLTESRLQGPLSRLTRGLRRVAEKRPVPFATGAAALLLLLGVLLGTRFKIPETAAEAVPEPASEPAAEASAEFTAEVAEKLEALRQEQRVDSSRKLHAEGGDHLASYRKLSAQLQVLRKQHQDQVNLAKAWQPVWEREEELSLWGQVFDVKKRIALHYATTFNSLVKAYDTAPSDSPERRKNQAALVSLRQHEDELALTLGPEVLSPILESLHRGSEVPTALGSDISIASDPADADVFCFRFERREGRLMPLAFDPVLGRDDPERGVVGKPYLLVERIWDTSQGVPFEADDILVSVNGKAVQTRSDLARLLASIAADDAVEVAVRRSGKRRTLNWVPFPGSRYEGDGAFRPPLAVGRIVNFRTQFSFTLSGYPLEFVDSCHLGSRQSGKALRTWLPVGSYLLVAAKDGYVDARCPVLVTGQAANLNVKLLEAGATPPGFVYVPAGPFTSGGAWHAIPGPVYVEREAGGFLIGGLEVTVGEYLEFLNDPLEHINKDGLAALRPWPERALGGETCDPRC